MIVDVRSINMRADNKGVPPLCEGQRQLLSDAVCLFGRHLVRQKGLTGMVGDNILSALITPGELCVLPFGKRELRVGGFGIAHKRGNKFTVSCFFRVGDIVNDILDRPAAPGMDGHELCSGDKRHLLFVRMGCPAWYNTFAHSES